MPVTDHHTRSSQNTIELAPTHRHLARRADDLGSCHADMHARVRRLERDGVELPPSLRRALAEFTAEVDAVRSELDGFSAF